MTGMEAQSARDSGRQTTGASESPTRAGSVATIKLQPLPPRWFFNIGGRLISTDDLPTCAAALWPLRLRVDGRLIRLPKGFKK